jgi:hypothetical protein
MIAIKTENGPNDIKCKMTMRQFLSLEADREKKIKRDEFRGVFRNF